MSNKHPNFNVIPGNKTQQPKAKRPINPQMTIQVQNPETNKLIDTWKADQTAANLAPVLNSLRGIRVLVPAMMREVNGKTVPIPATLVDKEGQKFLWAFTDRTKLPTDKKEQGYMNMAFLDLVKLTQVEKADLTGIAVNPITGGITIKAAALKAMSEGEVQVPQPSAPITVPALNNDALEEIMTQFKENPSLEKQTELVNALWNARVIVPVEMVEKEGKQLPVPMVHKDQEENKRIPIYTSTKNIPEGDRKNTMLNIPFKDVLRTAVNLGGKDEKFIGTIFNPTVHGIIFNNQIVKLINDRMQDSEKPQQVTVEDFAPQAAQPQQIKLTGPQYLAFEHIQFESNFFPKKFFTEGQEFVDQLCERRETYMDELFEESYQNKRLYPYLEEEFSVMPLAVEENLDVVSVDFPSRDQTVGCCTRAFLLWNKAEQTGRYFAILRGKNNTLSIMEIDKDGMGTDCGACPSEGNELNRVLELAKA